MGLCYVVLVEALRDYNSTTELTSYRVLWPLFSSRAVCLVWISLIKSCVTALRDNIAWRKHSRPSPSIVHRPSSNLHDRLWTEEKCWPGGLLILYMICHHMPGKVTCNTTKLFCHVVSRFSVREVSLPCGARAISSRFMAFVLAWAL